MSKTKNPRLVGGALCLDFVNSVDPRDGAERRDYLGNYDELVRWALHADAVDAAEAKRLRRRTGASTRRRVWRRAVAFREALYSLLRAVAEGRDLDPGQLAAVDSELARARARLALRVAPDGSVDEALPDDPALPLWRVALSARELLLALPRIRLRVCAGDDCGWLFVDASKAGLRRWCSMADCGNRAKARRHYARRQPRRGALHV
jgi:predicted RNA-binding Zn ribbon-like protein